jgi:CheY-like chemotaxis protein
MDQPLVIITDDDSSDRLLLKLAFEEVGLKVQLDEFEDGAQLIDFITAGCKGNPPNLILLDINMPKKSGIDVLEHIKKNPAQCVCPIVILSTSSDPGDKTRTKALGAIDYIVKPADYTGYLEIVKSLNKFL